jgi:predicted ATP-grasp superfamily ATP-dependent carboligase
VSDTPRTDTAIAASNGQWSFPLRDLAQELERELAAERALADRLAGELQWWGDYCGDNAPASIDLSLAAWKEARRA